MKTLAHLPLLLAFAAAPLLAAEAGFSAGLDTTVDATAGVRGGARRGETLHGLALGHAAWQQPATPTAPFSFQAYASVLSLVGHGPTERVLGDFLTASNIEGYPSTRLYSWWLEVGTSAWSLRTGALLADEEFAGTSAGGNFTNSAFGWPPFISANTVNTGPAFFAAALGARFEYHLNDSVTWRAGVYDGDTFDSPSGDATVNRHGWHYHLGGTQGWFAITEAAFTPANLPSRFKAGAWLHTGDFADVRRDAAGRPFADTRAAPRNHDGNYGAYAALEHTLSGKPGAAGNLETYVRAGLSPTDRNAIGWALDTGLACTGLLPGRPADVAALGLAHASFSRRYAAHARAIDPASPALDSETVVELAYRISLSERFKLQPDVQYIRHPGGSSAQRDALAVLLRLTGTF